MKIITDNAQYFESNKLIILYNKYHITLGHSIAYYPQGNGLGKSSNKSIVRIIKKVLRENKRSWNLKLKFSLWAEKICTKRSIATYTYEFLYGTEEIFPTSIVV